MNDLLRILEERRYYRTVFIRAVIIGAVCFGLGMIFNEFILN